MEELIATIARGLVDDKEAVSVTLTRRTKRAMSFIICM